LKNGTPPSNSAATPTDDAATTSQDSDELKPVVVQQEQKAPEWRGVAKRDTNRAASPGTEDPAQAPSQPLPPESVPAQQIIGQLAKVDISRGELTPEQAKYLGENIKRLASEGAAAVPAMREFLERNQDLSFDG